MELLLRISENGIAKNEFYCLPTKKKFSLLLITIILLHVKILLIFL